jgi:hypothetical protein
MAKKKAVKVTAPVGPPAYHCGICEQSFFTHGELSYHLIGHPDISNSGTHVCVVCSWDFDDSHAFELHKIQSGHTAVPFSCRNCDRSFLTQKGLIDHQKWCAASTAAKPSNEPPKSERAAAMTIYCDRCKKDFRSRQTFDQHRSLEGSGCADYLHKTPPKKQLAPPPPKGYIDPDKPVEQGNTALVYDNASEISDTPTIDSDGGMYCHDCKSKFPSIARHNNHMLGCTPVPSKAREVLQATAPAREQSQPLVVNYTVPEGPRSHATGSARSLAEASHPMPLQTVTLNTRPPVHQPREALQATGSAAFVCDRNGCSRAFRSEAGLRQHKVDSHGIGGSALDLTGRDAWMINQRERERLRAEGLLRVPSGPTFGRGGSNAPPARPHAPPVRQPAPAGRSLPRPPPPLTASRPPPVHKFSPRGPSGPSITPNMPHHQPLPNSMNMGGVAELDQAKSIQSKNLRLLIQSDIFIYHDGKMEVCGIPWTRIGVARQPDVVDMFDKMCHLPKMLQGEYLPPPKAFKSEYTAQYPAADFQPSPARNPAKPGLGVVALSCCKVLLADGRDEVVKIAAVDLVTCRVLMNHLVCTDPKAKVKDWRSSITGLFSWHDMEGARQAGYKVFKGWAAARCALHKFIDKDTIIVGHNLRSDLDALRMIHGRAVDMAKVVEKAANGPLNKAQLALDSLCKNYPAITLKSDPEYGRDSLMNTFAAREFGLWAIKNEAELKKSAKQKSLEYLVANPRAAAAA